MIVITGDYGQLGNRLVVFANFIAAAQEHGFRVANPSFHAYARYFEGTRADLLCRFPLRRSVLAATPAACQRIDRLAFQLQRYARKFRHRTRCWPPGVRVCDIGWYERCNLDAPEFLAEARRPGLLFAKGWQFRTGECLRRHSDVLRAVFTPVLPHQRRAAAAVFAARQRGAVVIGVHIRRGDYRQFLGGRFYYAMETYRSLMESARRCFDARSCSFLVCSNEPVPDGFDRLPVQIGPGHVVEDLYALAGCDYLIGPPSTFTAWASFYGKVPLYTVTLPDAPIARDDFRTVHDFCELEEHYRVDPGGVRASRPPVCSPST